VKFNECRDVHMCRWKLHRAKIAKADSEYATALSHLNERGGDVSESQLDVYDQEVRAAADGEVACCHP
jgi:hypothetical protein